MKKIDEKRLESDVVYRYEYVTEFIRFGEADVAAIHVVAPRILPLVTRLVEQTYDRLLAFDATRRHFVPRQHGYEARPVSGDPANGTPQGGT